MRTIEDIMNDEGLINSLAEKTLSRLNIIGIDQMLAGSYPDACAKADKIIADLENKFEMRRSDESEAYVVSTSSGVDVLLNKLESGSASIDERQHQDLVGSVFETSKAEAAYYKKQADSLYYAGVSQRESAPAGQAGIKEEFIDPQRFQGYKNNAAQAVPPKRPEYLYERNCFTASDGTTKEYRVVRRNVDWGSDFSDRDIKNNIPLLERHITDDIEEQFGGWDRIKEIYVRNQQLIINGVLYVPLLNGEFEGKFPLDTYSIIQCGYLADLFDWGKLRHMRNLSVLDIDDANFYMTTLADGLGLSRRIGVKSIFKIVPHLRMLVVAGYDLRSGEEATEKGVGIKKLIAREKHFVNLFDGLELNICSNTKAFSGWTFNNLKAYACNRGNKCLLRYGTGLLTRTAVSLGAGVANIGLVVGKNFLRNLGEGVKCVWEKCKDANDNC